MDARRWQRARDLFDRLADLPESAWYERLLVDCGDDAQLRDEVLSMLRADAGASARTDVSAHAPLVLQDLAESIADDEARFAQAAAGRLVGPFRLLREIGRGGMGAVWLAERADGAYAQQVAIKLIRGEWDADEAHARFRSERQILAGLQHPNIAHLVDGGVTADGKPWLALEYVDGEDLRAWCDRRRLGIEQRLHLLLTVCAAVAHAHQRLVVHRDLKPSNILVGRDGIVKLLDFGIAKLLDAPATAVESTRLFTPEYAAPEQLRGDAVTTAVDVYALGLLLYEVLVGRRARDLTDIALPSAGTLTPVRPSAALARTAGVRTARAAARRNLTPRSLRRRLHGDLDAIVLKALRDDPRQRYASVGELAADIERHLASRPVHARRGDWRYRTGRFLRRHAIAAAAASLGAIAVLGGGALAAWQAHVAAEQRDVAQREAETAHRTVDVLVDVFKSANPATHPGETVTPADLLDEGVRTVRRKLGGQPVQRAALLEALGRAHNALGTYAKAQPLIEEALALRVAAGDRLAEASVRLALGAVWSRQSRNDEALTEAERAFALAAGDSRQAAELRATADLHAGIELANLDRWSEAEPRLRRSAQARAMLFGKDTEPYWQVLVPWTFNLAARERPDDALALVEPAWQAIAARTTSGDWERSYLLGARSYALTQAGRYDEAVAVQREALSIAQRVYGDDHPNTNEALVNLASALYRAGGAAESADAYARAIAWRVANPRRKVLRRPDNQLRGWALALDAAGRSAEAIDVLARMREERKTIDGVSASEYAEAWLLIARAQRHAHRFDDAGASLDAYRNALASIEGIEGSAVAAGLVEQTWLALALGTADRECADAQRAVSLLDAARAKRGERLHAQAALAACWIGTGQRDRAAAAIAVLTGDRPRLLPVEAGAVDDALRRWRAAAATQRTSASESSGQ